MNIEYLGSLGELVGGIAVIFSFIFLAFQIRQNTRAIRAQSSRESESENMYLNREISQNPELAGFLIRFVDEGAKLEDFTPTERFRYHTHIRGVFQLLQMDYYQYLEGSLPDYVWNRRVKWYRSFLEYPIPRALFDEDIGQSAFDDRFVKALLETEVSFNIRWDATGGD